MIVRGRYNSTPPHLLPGFVQLRGEGLSKKLTDQSVRDIRRLKSEGATAAALAKQFDISAPHALRIATRKSWIHVV